MQKFKKYGIMLIRGINMAKFSDIFLSEVSKYALSLSEMHDRQGELSPQLFQKHLHQLVKNVHPSEELTSIFFECGYNQLPQKEKNTTLEQKRIQQLQNGLLLLAQVPSGRELLSHMPLDIYMYAMMQDGKGYFSVSEKMLAISSRHQMLWGTNQYFVKTLAHEMAHARHNDFIQGDIGRTFYNNMAFSPKAFFLECVFDELGARLMAEKVYGDLRTSGRITEERICRPISVCRLIGEMETSGYFYSFAQEIADKVGHNMNVILDEDDTLDNGIGRIFSYYTKLYPALRQKNVLNKIDEQYRKLVLYPAGRSIGLNRYDVHRRFRDLGYGK